MKNTTNTRRDFIKKSVGASAAIAVGGILPGYSALSYGRIVGANEKIRASVVGVNSRGNALALNFASQPNCDRDGFNRRFGSRAAYASSWCAC